MPGLGVMFRASGGLLRTDLVSRLWFKVRLGLGTGADMCRGWQMSDIVLRRRFEQSPAG